MKYTMAACVIVAAIGCHRGKTNVPTVAESTDSRDTRTPAQRAIGRIPVAKRTLTQVDLNQLLNYMNQYHASHNRYPSTMAEMDELSVSRDLPKVARAVQDGELILAGGKGGVLAYEAAALEDRGNVVTTNGIQMMNADELRKLLGR